MQQLSDVAGRQTCAIYNELSHITPYYLTPEITSPLDFESELAFHKKNILLLALTFEKILICTDNIAAFTRYTSKDIISNVVLSRWFNRLLDVGIVSLCGWGSTYGLDLMENQIDYSMRYRPDLKPASYMKHLRNIGRGTDIILREPTYGERDHIVFLRDKIRHTEGALTLYEASFLSNLTEQVQDDHGFVGTMEIFPFVDDIFLSQPHKANLFYASYYKSWQEYCSMYYAPAITVDSWRVRLPARRTRIKFNNRDTEIISSLYSPDFFCKFVAAHFGERVALRILDIDVDQLLSVRNGDWKVFLEKYHQCLAMASEAAWIVNQARRLDLLTDETKIEEIIDYIFGTNPSTLDFSSAGSLLDLAIRSVTGISFLGPISSIFRAKINSRLSRFVRSIRNHEIEPFLRKLNALLSGSISVEVAT